MVLREVADNPIRYTPLTAWIFHYCFHFLERSPMHRYAGRRLRPPFVIVQISVRTI